MNPDDTLPELPPVVELDPCELEVDGWSDVVRAFTDPPPQFTVTLET